MSFSKFQRCDTPGSGPFIVDRARVVAAFKSESQDVPALTMFLEGGHVVTVHDEEDRLAKFINSLLRQEADV
jgi:hypothetical protein